MSLSWVEVKYQHESRPRLPLIRGHYSWVSCAPLQGGCKRACHRVLGYGYQSVRMRLEHLWKHSLIAFSKKSSFPPKNDFALTSRSAGYGGTWKPIRGDSSLLWIAVFCGGGGKGYQDCVSFLADSSTVANLHINYPVLIYPPSVSSQYAHVLNQQWFNKRQWWLRWRVGNITDHKSRLSWLTYAIVLPTTYLPQPSIITLRQVNGELTASSRTRMRPRYIVTPLVAIMKRGGNWASCNRDDSWEVL